LLVTGNSCGMILIPTATVSGNSLHSRVLYTEFKEEYRI